MTVLARSPRFADYAQVVARRYAGDTLFVYPDVGLLRGILSGKAAYLRRGKAKAFVALDRSGEPAAFCIAFVDPGLQLKTGRATGSIGYFEALDERASTEVLDAARVWLAGEGVREVWAPFNGKPYNQMGAREDRFDEPPFIGCAHNPPTTTRFLGAAGFELVNRYLNFEIDLTSRPWERFDATRIERMEVRLRPASRLQFRREVLSYVRLHNTAFRTVWGEVEISDVEALQTLMRSRLAIVPELFQFAMAGGTEIGFVLCMPDLSGALAPLHVPLTSPRGVARLARVRKRATGVGLLSLAVAPEHQGGGVGTALVAAACRAAAGLRFRHLEYALVAENNEPSKATAARFGGKPCRSFGIYGSSIG